VLQYKSDHEPFRGCIDVLGKEQHLKFLSLSILQLDEDLQVYGCENKNEECAIVPISGKIKLSVDDEFLESFGGRDSVFTKPADVGYVSTNSRYKISLCDHQKNAKVLICKSVSQHHYSPFIINGTDTNVVKRGKKQWMRSVRNIMCEGFDEKVDKLVLGETINNPGQWSGYPPHRHSKNIPPMELPFEEIYYYEFKPENGFGVQVHYGSDYEEDQGYLIKTGDAFAIPDGFHPVVAGGGYKLYYLWFMAGPSGRNLMPYKDPIYQTIEKI
jgi:5-deoxy-glucuronate isomerase